MFGEFGADAAFIVFGKVGVTEDVFEIFFDWVTHIYALV
jgi:hypothetical protein